MASRTYSKIIAFRRARRDNFYKERLAMEVVYRCCCGIDVHKKVIVKSSYFFAQYQRISARRGKNRATLAVAHSMLIAIYHILKNKTAFHDLGSDYYDSFNRDRKINSYLKRLKALGWEPDAISNSA